MAQINEPTDYFNTVTYTGNGSTQSITGVGFQSDFRWLKQRSIVGYHQLNDTIRGITKYLFSNATDAEYTDSSGFTAIGSDGFTVGSNAGFNTNGATYVAWNWLAGGTASSNTDGTITSTVSASTTSGFSICTWTSTGSAHTVGHGLGVAPSVIIVKTRHEANSWLVYHHKNTSAPETDYLELNSTVATADFPVWNDTAPTSSVFSIGTWSGNDASGSLVAYCFAEKKGFSKFGSYTGNGSTDGTFVYTGMRPAWVLIKRTNSAGNNWQLYDNKRNAFNVINNVLFPNLSDAEATQSTTNIDMLSQGFKLRGNSATVNGSGDTYIYMAFAQNPLVGTNNIPATAR